MRLRSIEPEWLDQLSPGDPRAMRSRRDLRRVNAWMGNAWIAGRGLRTASRRSPPRRIIDLGTGDGFFLECCLRHLRPLDPGVEVVLLDQQDAVDPRVMDSLEIQGFRPRKIHDEASQGLRSLPSVPGTWVVSNLFLHHLDAVALQGLLGTIAEHAELCLACEPRRNRWSRMGAQLLWLLGANDVTRHDAVLSVQAGFRDRELSVLWPTEGAWTLTERSAGLFSHLFLAQRS